MPGRGIMGGIDIGGLKRFGPQSSANLRLVQNVFSLQNDLTHTRGAHLLKAGGLVEHYQDNMVNPTFRLGIYRFAEPVATSCERPGELPRPDAGGAVRPLLALHAVRRLRAGRLPGHAAAHASTAASAYETTTMPEDIYGRDSALPDLMARAADDRPLYDIPPHNISPRAGVRLGRLRRRHDTAVRGGYGLYFNTNSHQNLIVTVTNPPATPRPVIVEPDVPESRRSTAPGRSRSGRSSTDIELAARARVQPERAARDLGADDA